MVVMMTIRWWPPSAVKEEFGAGDHDHHHHPTDSMYVTASSLCGKTSNIPSNKVLCFHCKLFDLLVEFVGGTRFGRDAATSGAARCLPLSERVSHGCGSVMRPTDPANRRLDSNGISITYVFALLF
jgi:hypothetical protein